jgi:hypothetical protein
VGPLRAAPPLGQSTEEVLAELAGHEDPADEAGTEPEHVL